MIMSRNYKISDIKLSGLILIVKDTEIVLLKQKI